MEEMGVPLVSFDLKEKYLLVVGHGKRDNLSSMIEASALIYEKIIETNCHNLLVDYRNLEINVHMNEAFNIVRRYETTQPGLKQITIAAVFTEKGLEFGNYWKEIGIKRGFHISIFEDIAVAEKWLETKLAGEGE
jgi:hypothetical protein